MKTEYYVCDCANEISKLVNLTTLLQKKIVSASEITMSQATTILNIYEKKEISMSELCKLDGIDCSTLTRNIQQLQKQGWVQKKISPRDKRISLISLTTEGREKALLIKNSMLSKWQQILETVSEDSCKQVFASINTLVNILQSLEENRCEHKDRCKC